MSLFIDRNGAIACRYVKAYPYWGELGMRNPAVPGPGALTFDADFGRVGFAICFDANFPGLWADMAEGGAQLVLFCSAYSAGRQLLAHSLNHHFAIATCTSHPDAALIDVAGREVARSEGESPFYAELDLDQCLLHTDFHEERVARLLFDHPSVCAERFFRENWILLSSGEAQTDVTALAAAYRIEPLRAYKARSRSSIDTLRR